MFNAEPEEPGMTALLAYGAFLAAVALILAVVLGVAGGAKRQASRSAIMRLSLAPALPSPAPETSKALIDQYLPGSGVANMEARQRAAVAVLAVGCDCEVV